MAPVPLPDLNLKLSNEARGASESAWNSSGFVVNFGNGNSTAAGVPDVAAAVGAVPQWAYLAGAVLLGVMLFKRG